MQSVHNAAIMSLIFMLSLLLPASAFVPPLVSLLPARADIARPAVLPAVRMQYPQQQDQKMLVHRGRLVWPHAHAASLLMSAVVEFFGRLSRPTKAHLLPTPSRETTPMIVANALCDVVSTPASCKVSSVASSYLPSRFVADARSRDGARLLCLHIRPRERAVLIPKSRKEWPLGVLCDQASPHPPQR